MRTFEALPHSSLPQGTFKTWCGRKDRFLVGVNGQLEAYDAGVKSATMAVSSAWPVQCSDDGQQLVYVDTRMGYVTKVDIASGRTQFLASYEVSEVGYAHISFSSDLRVVATNRPLRLNSDGGDLRVIPTRELGDASAQGSIGKIKWSDDSSKLFVAYDRAVEVIDAQGRKIGSGPLPKGSYVRDGWFDVGQQELALYLALEKDESGPGLIIKCRIADWKCDRLRSRVDSVSVGGRGVMGTISPLGKTQIPDDDSTPIYPRYAAELRDTGSNLLVRQIFVTTGGRRNFNVSLAPSGTKAILTWHIDPTAGCKPPDARSSYCEQGMMIDLSKVFK